MKSFKFDRRELAPTQLISLSFISVIFIGAILLSLPISSNSSEFTPFLDSFFTSASATCVTGLVVYDTFTHWSIFGRTVIICLIQIGGLGFITILAMFSILMGKKIGLFERTLIMESAGFLQIGGVIRLVKKMIAGTLLVEAVGAIILSFKFMPQFGFLKGVGFGIFHSVSAFCNAGFDLMGGSGEFSSITAFSADATVVAVISALIIIGGIGFLVWDDILKNKFRFREYRLHTKIVLTSTLVLLVLGSCLFSAFEYDGAFKNMGFKEAFLSSVFASVTPRTAGFNTVDLGTLSDASIFLTVVLMAIGASPGSTGGGMKTTTVAVMFLSAISSSLEKGSISVFKRKIEDNALKKATSIVFLYLFAAVSGCLLLLAVEPFSLKEVIFEVFSAIGTVGLSLGVTPRLGAVSKLVIIVLMVGGRVGSLTVALALIGKKGAAAVIKCPEEKISVG